MKETSCGADNCDHYELGNPVSHKFGPVSIHAEDHSNIKTATHVLIFAPTPISQHPYLTFPLYGTKGFLTLNK